MDTDTDGAGHARSYTLRCVDCAFQTNVEGDVFEVLDTIDRHQEEQSDGVAEHFVEFETDGAMVQTADAGD